MAWGVWEAGGRLYLLWSLGQVTHLLWSSVISFIVASVHLRGLGEVVCSGWRLQPGCRVVRNPTCPLQGVLSTEGRHPQHHAHVGRRELGEKRGHPWAPRPFSCQMMPHLSGQLSPDPVPPSLPDLVYPGLKHPRGRWWTLSAENPLPPCTAGLISDIQFRGCSYTT